MWSKGEGPGMKMGGHVSLPSTHGCLCAHSCERHFLLFHFARLTPGTPAHKQDAFFREDVAQA